MAEIIHAAPIEPHGPWNPPVKLGLPDHVWPKQTVLDPRNVRENLTDLISTSQILGKAPEELVTYRSSRIVLHAITINCNRFISIEGAEESHLAHARELSRKIGLVMQDCTADIPGIIEKIDALHEKIGADVKRDLAMLQRGPLKFASILALISACYETGGYEMSEERRCSALRRETIFRVADRLMKNGHDLDDPHIMEVMAERAVSRTFNKLATRLALDETVEMLRACIEQHGWRELPQYPSGTTTFMLKGSPAVGNSSALPFVDERARQIGIVPSDMMVVNPDAWRYLLVDATTLGDDYAYFGRVTNHEMEQIKGEFFDYVGRPGVSHSNFVLDHFLPDPNELFEIMNYSAKAHIYFLTARPEQLLERSFTRGQEVGRYMATEEVLAAAATVHSLLPIYFLAASSYKGLEIEVLDNSGPLGSSPTPVAKIAPAEKRIEVSNCPGFCYLFQLIDLNISAKKADELFLSSTPDKAPVEALTAVSRKYVINFSREPGAAPFATLHAGRLVVNDQRLMAEAVASHEYSAALLAKFVK